MKKSVLVVEDQRNQAEFLAQKLRNTSAQLQPEIACNIAEATEKLSHRTFNLILLDLGLQDSSGIYTYNTIQSLALHTPIVVITILEDDSTQTAIENAGAFSYLVKGRFSDEEFSNVILTATGIKMKEKPFACPVVDSGESKQPTLRNIVWALCFIGACSASAISVQLFADSRYVSKYEGRELLVAIHLSEERALTYKVIELNAVPNKTDGQLIVLDLARNQLQKVQEALRSLGGAK